MKTRKNRKCSCFSLGYCCFTYLASYQHLNIIYNVKCLPNESSCLCHDWMLELSINRPTTNKVIYAIVRYGLSASWHAAMVEVFSFGQLFHQGAMVLYRMWWSQRLFFYYSCIELWQNFAMKWRTTGMNTSTLHYFHCRQKRQSTTKHSPFYLLYHCEERFLAYVEGSGDNIQFALPTEQDVSY